MQLKRLDSRRYQVFLTPDEITPTLEKQAKSAWKKSIDITLAGTIIREDYTNNSGKKESFWVARTRDVNRLPGRFKTKEIAAKELALTQGKGKIR